MNRSTDLCLVRQAHPTTWSAQAEGQHRGKDGLFHCVGRRQVRCEGTAEFTAIYNVTHNLNLYKNILALF